jgi:hypothetical protein
MKTLAFDCSVSATIGMSLVGGRRQQIHTASERYCPVMAISEMGHSRRLDEVTQMSVIPPPIATMAIVFSSDHA